MKRALAILALSLAAVSCASNYDDEPEAAPPGRRGRMPMARGERAGGGLLEMLPPDGWWRDPQISVSVDLTNDQIGELDRLSASQGDDAARLERDLAVAMRDVRTTVESERPTRDDIVAAANRVKALRDLLFDRQAELLASERALLTQQQWTSLQRALAEQGEERMNRRRGDYPGGMRPRGGRGRGGRFPG